MSLFHNPHLFLVLFIIYSLLLLGIGMLMGMTYLIVQRRREMRKYMNELFNKLPKPSYHDTHSD